MKKEKAQAVTATGNAATRRCSNPNRFGQDSVYPGNPTYSDISSADSTVYCMVSNHATDLIMDHYNGYQIETVEAKRMINRDGSNRTEKEVFITNNQIHKYNE